MESSEVKAVQYDREAEELEKKANLEQDPIEQERLRNLAKFRRQDAAISRQKHFYNPPKMKIVDGRDFGEIDRPFPRSHSSGIKGMVDFTLGYGSGDFISSPGGEFQKNPYLIFAANAEFIPRSSLGYDNIINYNSVENRTVYGIFPRNLRIRYTDESNVFGFMYEGRGFILDSSYNGFASADISSRGNAIVDSEYRYFESKFSYFYREDWSYDKTFTLILGLRTQNHSYMESGLLPNARIFNDYTEQYFGLGPNIGMNYSQNFFGVFVFTAGLELTVGGGVIDYETLVLRDAGINRPANFSKMTMEDPVLVSYIGGEFYTKFEILINEKNRFGIGLNYHDFNRITENTSTPLYLSNDFRQIQSDYTRYFIRNLIYNEDGKSGNPTRYSIMRTINLEYTYVF
ncbi:hypothetical protein [Leptospira sp. GIMC2001]|uniref:hypothetical protein n=1 Tax=Leptospira sp. GIMC2001 TaxID=1513297 RepID=UPI00234B650F|nr:hypothetical protein [Leptospira sp. GIMC2001]WCL47763.1 hypothetical protein O4O04_00465 [Leptospira sp. GIMC2001]